MAAGAQTVTVLHERFIQDHGSLGCAYDVLFGSAQQVSAHEFRSAVFGLALGISVSEVNRLWVLVADVKSTGSELTRDGFIGGLEEFLSELSTNAEHAAPKAAFPEMVIEKQFVRSRSPSLVPLVGLSPSGSPTCRPLDGLMAAQPQPKQPSPSHESPVQGSDIALTPPPEPPKESFFRRNWAALKLSVKIPSLSPASPGALPLATPPLAPLPPRQPLPPSPRTRTPAAHPLPPSPTQSGSPFTRLPADVPSEVSDTRLAASASPHMLMSSTHPNFQPQSPPPRSPNQPTSPVQRHYRAPIFSTSPKATDDHRRSLLDQSGSCPTSPAQAKEPNALRSMPSSCPTSPSRSRRQSLNEGTPSSAGSARRLSLPPEATESRRASAPSSPSGISVRRRSLPSRVPLPSYESPSAQQLAACLAQFDGPTSPGALKRNLESAWVASHRPRRPSSPLLSDVQVYASRGDTSPSPASGSRASSPGSGYRSGRCVVGTGLPSDSPLRVSHASMRRASLDQDSAHPSTDVSPSSGSPQSIQTVVRTERGVDNSFSLPPAAPSGPKGGPRVLTSMDLAQAEMTKVLARQQGAQDDFDNERVDTPPESPSSALFSLLDSLGQDSPRKVRQIRTRLSLAQIKTPATSLPPCPLSTSPRPRVGPSTRDQVTPRGPGDEGPLDSPSANPLFKRLSPTLAMGAHDAFGGNAFGRGMLKESLTSASAFNCTVAAVAASSK
mmetsp:Transcript_12934/g.29778  ORF Transcript_12934/g.29778 Transcript_12934/m.29778 type:complete len:724 (+) Transcript_12934:29-2200(+)|eukprot:CAMPEP_0114550810 /NCGR_PEP_ID=MMETSP0114-20121206/6268_1 /TAXON_ID=31324 /ORGANISM="Goniomonas sp, Strain m" /LENGTH=723 /DNA_ID=CAMNT_0001735601 /DNA_START=13 /DNA_END=2184 /DNA_ORIENTATION=-